MRLLNVKSLELEAFNENAAPSYAILSHTWGSDKDEVSYEELSNGSVNQKAGYRKIRQASAVAAQRGLSYIWIDTCCIDKSSSSELSETINSMFRWYKNSEVCFAYLEDVPAIQNGRRSTQENDFKKSRWFTRGWTLQELLAPRSVIFFSRNWQQIGSKIDMATQISQITNIDKRALRDLRYVQSTSLAKRMSWAANRQTTREEDIAYCLLGIFGVNMPLLYGEGPSAFVRLQEEIMKASTDQSLFAWNSVPARPLWEKGIPLRGLFARHPREFSAASGNWASGMPLRHRPHRLAATTSRRAA